MLLNRLKYILSNNAKGLFCVTQFECSSNNVIRLLRNFPTSLGVCLSNAVKNVVYNHGQATSGPVYASYFAKVHSCLYEFDMYAMKYVVLFVTKLISYTNAFISLNGFPSPSFNREGMCRNTKFSNC